MTPTSSSYNTRFNRKVPVGAWEQGHTHVIAVASGKGGVGKTNIVANLSVAFAQSGLRVLALDGDLGLSNLDIAMGIDPDYTLMDLVEGTATVEQVLTMAAENVHLLPGCSGRYELANLDTQGRHSLFAAVDTLEADFDILLIDTGAGINSNAIDFASAAQTVVVIANSEPTSMADAYALIKVMNQRAGVKEFQLLTNMVRSVAEGEDVYSRLAALADKFLGVSVHYLGEVMHDAALPRCLRSRQPMMLKEPDAVAAQCIRSAAKKLLAMSVAENQLGGIKLFWKRIAGWSEVA
jgi:flagellar biosynthesis protein FlhG